MSPKAQDLFTRLTLDLMHPVWIVGCLEKWHPIGKKITEEEKAFLFPLIEAKCQELVENKDACAVKALSILKRIQSTK
jgi:hypothetical protein